MSLTRQRAVAALSLVVAITGFLTYPLAAANAEPSATLPEGGVAISEIQGTGAASAMVDQTVLTRGVVTASYPTGGFNGFYLQTDGTGGATDATPGASDAIFIYGSQATAAKVAIGDLVDVSGVVSEYQGLTEITAQTVTPVSGETPVGVTPLATAYPISDTAREAHEGELLAPTDEFVVSDNYTTNQYAEIVLATGGRRLVQPTEVADAQDAAAIAAVVADNAARRVTLDDGASLNFLSSANTGTALPWLAPTNPVRVGAAATFKAPVILDFRNNNWKFQPQQRVSGDGRDVVTFADTRTAAPEAVGGDLKLATFNVLNYFNTTGADYVAAGNDCTSYSDRAGEPVTVNDCGATGPRGAWDAADLQRQQDKIVAAINALGADIVSLEELENSVVLGEQRDDAISALVAALNAGAPNERWAFVPSPAAADLPPVAEQDVIRTGFIYNPARVALVGGSQVLVGDPAFSNARQPLAQAFKPVGGADGAAFAVIVNHFKSKGSGVDDGTGQGNANPDRIAQAKSLVAFADAFATERGLTKTFLTGDFNAYSMEDPVQELEAAGYTAIKSDTEGETTYNFGAMAGSLDHVFANEAAAATVSGADIWNINSVEALAFEYSRDNYNVTDFYSADPFRSSDHDPEIVGINTAGSAADTMTLNLLGVNDYHGRINENAPLWAGTVEELRATDPSHTLLISSGDLIGASEFPSAVAQDQPTIDMFNALDLDASAVGNHEFDGGWADLRDRVIGPAATPNAQWPYLGANVYAKGTQTPVLPEFANVTVDGLDVAVIGAVTEETKSLVSPGGIADIDFGNAVAAINRVAAKLSDGDPANGEADVIVASIHAGASTGVGSSYDVEAAKGGEFAEMAKLDPSVDAIFNAHTHQVYAWDAPVPNAAPALRPILQTGQYGDNVGQIQLTVDKATGDVTDYSARNVPRTTTPLADLLAAYPRVGEVKDIVDAALAHADEVGSQPVGSITADFTRAFRAGEEDRGAESTLGDLVANALRDGLPADAGTADLGIVNPGGLRADLTYAGDPATPANSDGVLTYAEANAVLPFVNNIWTIQLSGAQLKQVLEQQWQPAGASRPFLALGLSDNVRVTQDPTAPVGQRITSVYLNDQPLDPSRTYTVSTFSFLGTGGDNFTAFSQGTSRDTGLVDRDLWIGYLRANPDLAPDFARQQVVESQMPTEVAPGDRVAFTLSNLDLTSLGSPNNTEVAIAYLDGATSTPLGTVPVTAGSAEVNFTVPTSVQGGQITLTAAPSNTLVTIPVGDATETRVPATVSARLNRDQAIVFRTRLTATVRVTAPGVVPTGRVGLFSAGSLIASAQLRAGTARIPVGPFQEVGPQQIEFRYLGDSAVLPGSTRLTVRVVKQRPRMTMSVPTAPIRAGSAREVIAVRVSAAGFVPKGRVQISFGKKTFSARVTRGVARVRLGVFASKGVKVLSVKYSGSQRAMSVTKQRRIKVWRR